MNKDVFTTGEVARICNVSSPTVNKWIDTGMLKGFRIPGSRARRVARKDLLALMNEYGMPLDKLENIKTKILIIDDNILFGKTLERELNFDGAFDVLIVQNAFRAGVMLEEFKPEVVLLDILLDNIDGRDICKFLRENQKFKHVRIIGMSGVFSQDAIMQEDGCGFDGFIKKPFKVSELKEKIHELQGIEILPSLPNSNSSGEIPANYPPNPEIRSSG